MSMDFSRLSNSLKKRRASKSSRKTVIITDFQAPALPPSIPYDTYRTLTPNLLQPHDFEKNPARSKPLNEEGLSSVSALSLLEFDDAVASKEPLVHDFAAGSIPTEYTPLSGDYSVTPRGALPSEKQQNSSLAGDEYFQLASKRLPSRPSHVVMEHLGEMSSHGAVQAPKSYTRGQSSMQASQRRELPSVSDPAHDSDYSSNPDTTKPLSSQESVQSFETRASSVPSINTLPALQNKSALAEGEHLEPLMEDDPFSFDLVQPTDGKSKAFELEERNDLMFSCDHLQEIFNDTPLLLEFTNFLSSRRPKSIPVLVYYLDALKALRAINYANAVADSLDPIEEHEFSHNPARPTMNSVLEDKASAAFQALARDDLPAFITHTFIRVVTVSIQRRITGTLPPHLREASEGLAEVFCLTDPSRQDNPIVFASEEFHRTSQYGVNYAIGRNCRFLQGPRTNKYSVERMRKAIAERREVSETFLNYRRDGSPFMNLLMVAPLLDSKGTTRYFIGAQVDVSGLCKECTDLPALQKLIAKREANPQSNSEHEEGEGEDPFQELSEMFSEAELGTVRKYGGKMHREQIDENDEAQKRADRPRLLIKEPSDPMRTQTHASNSLRNGKLEGIYTNYLLVRPYPSLRILFCSPSLRVPGILQSPFMDRIGGSERVRETLTAALADGRGVTAKVRWIAGRSGADEGRARWIHCTPLLGNNGAVGVWMVVLVEDDASSPQRRFRQPPPVSSDIGGKGRSSDRGGFYDAPMMETTMRRRNSQDAVLRAPGRPRSPGGGSLGNGSLESFTIA